MTAETLSDLAIRRAKEIHMGVPSLEGIQPTLSARLDNASMDEMRACINMLVGYMSHFVTVEE